MIDWAHVTETTVTTLFVAGAAYGAIKTELKALHDRIAQCEQDLRSLIFKR